MSGKTIHLQHVLARKLEFNLDLDAMTSDVVKQVGRFWLGVTTSNKLRKAEGISALKEVLQDHKRLADGVRSLPEKERQVLAICMRYGGLVSGPLLLTEALARGLVEKPREPRFGYGRQRTDDPVQELPANSCWFHPGEATTAMIRTATLPISATPPWLCCRRFAS